MVKLQHYPFAYHKDMQIEYHVPKHKLIMDIKKMFAEHFINQEDTIILDALARYEHLNAFLIYQIVSSSITSCNQSYITKRLHHLENYGLIKKFTFVYVEKDIKHKTPFVYEISSRAKKIFAYTKNNNMAEYIVLEPDYILRQLSYNQFHIFLEKQLSATLLMLHYQFNSISDGYFKVRINGKAASFYVFSIRNTNSSDIDNYWLKAYRKRLSALQKYIKDNELHCAGIIVIVETEMQALSAEKSRMSDINCKDYDVYYIIDFAAVADGFLLQHLIHVLPEKNYSTYDILKIIPDGNIRSNTDTICDTAAPEIIATEK